ncbi:hypothetical protein TraAM80_02195 [Trypanosoma rangeli]|uniref:ER membrane protein complex subunit 1 n=1 Tax=Trypanosoma rangeli TaxID=5698 RepID=A0A422NVA5_TRYRA|nr:uncharacterized protein TraAM80_02195 [Trypanosoma rangeli]RNF09398.1 hypothetical protein TraAM80_02195 [Trypanosoma rangeli]|eukprot:RNF09398.1 hypothetical protein TraAM80_02195 [Trypanosoma rangeli]
MRPLTPLLLLIVFLCVVVQTSKAIHEDEQGLRDWILRFVGHVDHASYQPRLEPNYMYAASNLGAVAALSLSDGSLQWRRLFSEPQVCVTAGRHGVLVSSRTGTIYLLNAAAGDIETTFKLSLPAGATVESCAIVEGSVRVAAMDKATAYLFQFWPATEDEVLMPSGSFSIGEDVHGLRISGNHIWALRPAGANRYSLTGDVEVADVEGDVYGGAVAVSGDAAVLSATKMTVVRNSGEAETVACDGCEAGLLLGATGTFEGTVKTTTDKLGFTVTFPGSSVRIAYNFTPGHPPTVLLAIRDEEHGAQAILRTANGHLLAVSEKLGKLLWERTEGLAYLAATIIADNPIHEDHFSFNKVALAVSTYGVVYVIPVGEMGHNIRVLADISSVLVANTAARSMKSVRIEQLVLSGENVLSVIAASSVRRMSLALDVITGAVKELKVYENSLVVSPAFAITRSLELHGSVPSKDMYLFTSNVTSGLIEGYVVSATSKVLPLWTVRMPYPLVAYATGEDVLRTTTVNQLRVFPNKTSKTDEVRRKYPTRNVIVVAHYEPSEKELTTLVLTAIDSVTGSVLATVRHRNVEGPVHMVVVENAVLYYYMDMVKLRHCLGVWEMFEEEFGQVLRKDAGATIPQIIASFFRFKRTFSSRATRPPTVTVAVLGVYGGNLATMGVTTSFNGIAGKSIVLAFDSGRIATVELSKLLAGGQMPLDDNGKQLTHVFIPSTALASHKYRVAKPRLITTTPTNLESSCHVLVSGLDIFYVRTSSGKAFDLLNSDFNKNLLITLTCGFGVLTCAARYLVRRRALNLLWK